MKVKLFISAAALTILAGTSAALTADPAGPVWLGQTVDNVTRVANMTPDEIQNLQPVTSDSFAGLLRIDESVATIAPSVSREVLDVRSIRKIGYGKETKVDIVSTPSGVYSSDGIASPHVLYPGIETGTSGGTGIGMLMALVGGNWLTFTPIEAGSFTHFGPGYMTTGKTTCVAGSNYHGCF